MDHDLTRLATLDPARSPDPAPERQARALARLEEQMARPGPVARRRPRGRRLAIGLAAAAVLGVGGILVVPTVLPSADTAYASWTPVPQDLPETQALAVAASCARNWGGPPGRLVLSERRGRSTFLIMWVSGGPLVDCFSGDGPSSSPASDRLSGDGNVEPPVPGAGRVSLGGGMWATRTGPAGWRSQAAGRVGAGVTGVDIALPDGRTVQATTRNGWWAAWWPGDEAGVTGAFRIVVHTAGGTRSYRQDDLGTEAMPG
ncbi:hypothetical protein AB0J83_41400 [Actinoplanes sp. NPDC049596]|uniref:hypothetical protein n=1 Tax=unclassified Actinoplanes TaxID=2626549 RepID=UPI0034416C89